MKSYKDWTQWREAGFGPGRTTRGCEPCSASETRRQASAGLAEQAGRLRLAAKKKRAASARIGC